MEADRRRAEVERASGALVSDLQAWRGTHPRASFTELEAAVDAQLDRLRARLLEELALASPPADGGREPAERPTCPTCGTAMAARGRRTRTVTVQGEQAVTLERRYWVCPACGAGRFPPR